MKRIAWTVRGTGRFTGNDPSLGASIAGILDNMIESMEYCILFRTSMPSMDQSAPADLTPLSPAVFHILLSLGEGERHGYALKREISLRTGGRLKLGPGVLYGSINKMLEMGLIEESEDRPDPHLDDERRRYYRITPRGRKVAQAEAARMSELVRLAAARFGVPKHA